MLFIDSSLQYIDDIQGTVMIYHLQLIKMGNKQQTALKKGYGYRIISVKPASPLEGHVDPFFDFIVETITQPSPKDILDKLTDEQKPDKPFMKLIKQQQGKPVTLKIYSSKFQNTREVTFTPNSNWNGHQDLVGIAFRLQKYEGITQNYSMINNIQNNSPVQQAKLVEGDYLIGVVEFKYESIDEMIDSLFEIFYDKNVINKCVRIATYNVKSDSLKLYQVELKRKWGGEGLLGCEFSQGHLYRFPKNLEELRTKILESEKLNLHISQARKELSNSDGASKVLAQSLKRKAQPKKKIFIKNPEQLQVILHNNNIVNSTQTNSNNPNNNEIHQQLILEQRRSAPDLQQRVKRLQQTVYQLQKLLQDQLKPQQAQL